MNPTIEQALLASILLFQADVEKTKNFTFQDGITFGYLTYNAFSFVKIKEFKRAGIKLSAEEQNIFTKCEKYIQEFNLEFFDISYLEEHSSEIFAKYNDFLMNSKGEFQCLMQV